MPLNLFGWRKPCWCPGLIDSTDHRHAAILASGCLGSPSKSWPRLILEFIYSQKGLDSPNKQIVSILYPWTHPSLIPFIPIKMYPSSHSFNAMLQDNSISHSFTRFLKKISKIKCPICGKEFPDTEDRIKSHLKQYHPDDLLAGSDFNTLLQRFRKGVWGAESRKSALYCNPYYTLTSLTGSM